MTLARASWPEQFRAFVERAAEGRNSGPRIALGTLLVIAVWLAGTIAVMVAGAFAWSRGWLPGPGPSQGADVLTTFTGTRAGLAVMILTLAAIWPGVWLAIRFIHRRGIRTLLGIHGRVDWADFGRGAAVMLIMAGALSTLNLLTEPTTARSSLDLSTWLAALPLLALILLIQTSAEEILFRGYLLQSLAQRFRSPWIWAALPILVFAACHWSPGALPWMNAAVVFSIALFAAQAVWLVWATGNLGAAMGTHFTNNLVALLFVASGTDAGSLALYVAPPIEDPAWTFGDALFMGAQQIVLCGGALVLLLWPGSPLALDAAKRPRSMPD